MKALLGILIGFVVVSYVNVNHTEAAAAAIDTVTSSTLAPVTSTSIRSKAPATTLPAAKPATPASKGKAFVVRGVTMPGNCLSLQPELVTYVEQHREVPDADIAGYVCGWY